MALWGHGFSFPQVYKELLGKIKTGEYGEKWKDLSLKEKNVAVDAERHVYLCKKCGYWSVEPGLSLYVPNDVKTLKKQQYGDSNVEDLGERPYVTSWDLKNNYHVLKNKIHKCAKCGEKMHRATFHEIKNLRCIECGGEPDINDQGAIWWD